MRTFITVLVLMLYLPMQSQEVKPWPKVKNLTGLDYITWTTMEALGDVDLSVNVVVKRMRGDREESAYVAKTGSYYTIYVNPLIDNITTVISHEALHIKQMEDGRLEAVEGGFMWDGEFYPDTMDYNLRPWEKDAHKKDYALTMD
tara:strand:- start:92 stop:526 length:435 start_codon:yes stop_codon:yes gene_type:complete